MDLRVCEHMVHMEWLFDCKTGTELLKKSIGSMMLILGGGVLGICFCNIVTAFLDLD